MIAYRIWQVAGWTMLHYLWVGGGLGTATLALRWVLRSAAANVRYLAALGGLALMTAAPPLIAVYVMHDLGPLPNSPSPTVGIEKSAATFPAAPLERLQPQIEPAAPAPLPAAPPPVPPPGASGFAAVFVPVLEAAALYLPWLWIVGAPLVLLLTTAGMVGAERLRRESRPAADATIAELCRRLADSLRLSRRVGVAVCDRIAGPILVGIVRPIILLPAIALAGWDPQQLEMVLLHELVHVRRWDNLVNLVQRIVESVLFFHPMIWVVSAWVRREREHCCDAAVVAHTRQPRAYAQLLVALAEQISRSSLAKSPLACPQAVSSMAQRPLVARIRRILKKEEQSMQVSRKTVGLVFAVLIGMALVIGGYCSRAGRAEDGATASKPREPQSETTPETKEKPLPGRQPTKASDKANDPPKELTVDLGKGIKLELVLIPAGEFKMGRPEGDKEEAFDMWVPPRHRVRITKPFYLGKYPVTQEQWQALMGSNPSHFKGPKNPVETVSWDDCQKFLGKLNAKVGGRAGKFQLPSEAQWEYACRAGSKTKYCFGDDETRLGDYAWYAKNSGNTTHPVGEKKPNAWGLYDMHGNVFEWCPDWWQDEYYYESPVDDPTGAPTGRGRVIRGGGWNSTARYCQSGSRGGEPPGYGYSSLGLRISRVPAEALAETLSPSVNDPSGKTASVKPADKASAVGTLTPWGEPIQGVSARVRSDKTVWRTGQVPSFRADIKNNGQTSGRVAQAQELCELVLDGVAYQWTGEFDIPESSLPPGREYHDILISLVDSWHSKKDNAPLTLAPGKHALRVIFVVSLGMVAGKRESIRAASNAVEFEVRPSANDSSAATSVAKPANKASPDSYKLSDEWTAAEQRFPPGFLPLPAYGKLMRLDVRQHYGINAAQEKKLREISAAFEAASRKASENYKEMQKLPPQERKKKAIEFSEQFHQRVKAVRKQVEDVLTAEQRADYRRDYRCDLAISLCSDPQQASKALGLTLSNQQERQLTPLMEEFWENNRKKRVTASERLLAVFTPQQREKLAERLSDAKVAAPAVDIPAAEGGRVTYTLSVGGKREPPAFVFAFVSDYGASVNVYPQLMFPAVRKELALTAEQEEKLQAVLVKSRGGAQRIFDQFQPKAGAAKPSPEAQTSRRAEFQRALDQFGKDVLAQIETALQPQQVATLKSIARKDKVFDLLARQDRAVLDDLHATAEQQGKLRRITEEFAVPDSTSFRAIGEKALGILTPEQRKKLEERLDRNAW